MLDPQLLRKSIDTVAARLQARGFELDVENFRRLEAKRKTLQVETQALQSERNTKSKMIGQMKSRGDDTSQLLKELAALRERLDSVQAEFANAQRQLDELSWDIPNILHETVPQGRNENDNVEVRRWGEQPDFAFAPADHVALGKTADMLDFEKAATIAGSRFVVMRGAFARLHRALTQFMLDLHTTEHGYTEVYVPYLVNRQSLFGTGQLPKFEEDQFATRGEDEYFLIPTAEVPVTNLVRDSITNEETLPLRYVCHTPCFRREAGSYGKDTRGMIRQHQFEKVELVQIVKPENSYDALEELTGHAEAVLKRLELPFRTVALCSGDVGFSSAKTYDLEVWLPGQERYREISSCSNFESFQARRLAARWRNSKSGATELVHTLNGSGVAVGRALVAVLENYQEGDGSVRVPHALRPYLVGLERIVGRT
jgi:seryl-tRNA synthetase